MSSGLDKVDSLSFAMPHGHPCFDVLEKMKTIITVEEDGEEVFRGRVVSEEVDYYNAKAVECEGEQGFLSDTLQRPYNFSGTVEDLFRQMIDKHNQQTDAVKQFTVGEITINRRQEAVEIKQEGYNSTAAEIDQKLLDAYGGHLRTRGVGETRYIDWLQDGVATGKEITFAVNLIELEDQVNAADVFTVLVPLGKTNNNGETSAALTIADVNGGLDYIEDAAGIAKYGRIIKVRQWPHIEDAAALLERGRQHLQEHGAAVNTINLQAVDMHYLGSGHPSIRVGDMVHIVSNPHGVDKTIICARMDVDMVSPEETRYIFGKPPKTLTDNVKQVQKATGGGGGGGSTIADEVEEFKEWSKIMYSENKGEIGLLSGVVSDQGVAIEQAGVRINGVEATVELKVSKNGVISSINVSPESITISAAKVNIEGATIINTLKSDVSTIKNAFTSTLTAVNFTVTGTFKYKSNTVTGRSITVDGETYRVLCI